jgi:predicted RNA-binding Zn-ribbon protein involved in translation (DUF1610 family)
VTIHAAALPLEAAQALVPGLPVELLAEAVSGSAFAFLIHDDVVYFRCPKCLHVDHNGPSARVQDAFRWRCDRCRAAGTRWLLERLVIEDAEHLERLAELLAAEEAA